MGMQAPGLFAQAKTHGTYQGVVWQLDHQRVDAWQISVADKSHRLRQQAFDPLALGHQAAEVNLELRPACQRFA
jgi:hypothetical protein